MCNFMFTRHPAVDPTDQDHYVASSIFDFMEEVLMKHFLGNLVMWVACVSAMVSMQQSHAAAPPAKQTYETARKPPVPTYPVDIAARADLGPKARWWGFVGSFELHEKGGRKVVALYYSDSNVNGWDIMRYPNFFALHAVTQDGMGRWIGHQVYSSTICHFGHVVGYTLASLRVEIQPEWILMCNPEWSPAEREEWLKIAAKANTPFTVTLSIRDGCPFSSLKGE